ncbi:hypothetical protein [Arthrobacter sp. A2-55]|uniref:hypothetical protein n=1 Tax=Arthrobacter sp. A2-55 TaxID=2897337 RepID=UPI0021CD537A|nr:hypothetical protein [Arthrobacter sp. A2-55]MCU6479108.1 hypothetical protein [Arthrobacter sp. A2-55]
MARKTKRTKAHSHPSWLQEVEEAPRGDIGYLDKASRRIKFNRFYIYFTIGLTPILALSIIAMLPKILQAPPAPVVAASQLNSPTKSVAMMAVESWLNQTPSPLPGGHLLSWDGVTIQQTPSIVTNKDTGRTDERQGLELHSMTVVTPSGAVFTTQVQVGYSPVRGAQVLGAPTLIPRAPDDKQTWPNLTSWPDLVKTGKSDEVGQAVTAWAKAFTSGDPDALRLAVGDTTPDRSYVPLVQATASDIQVEDVATKAPDPKAPSDAKPATVVARVSFAVTWQGQPVDVAHQAARISYDVLVERANTASPTVVAWGGAGTGETLTPYMNAVNGRKITADGIGNSIPTQSPAPAAPQAGHKK